MTVTVLHMRMDLDRDTRADLTIPRDDDSQIEVTRRTLDQGGYVPVAEIDTDDLEQAWVLTQNGVASPSWSRQPPEGVKPLGDGYIEINGERLGYKSSEVGDVCVMDGKAYVAVRVGFREIEGWTPVEVASPKAGGGG